MIQIKRSISPSAPSPGSASSTTSSPPPECTETAHTAQQQQHTQQPHQQFTCNRQDEQEYREPIAPVSPAAPLSTTGSSSPAGAALLRTEFSSHSTVEQQQQERLAGARQGEEISDTIGGGCWDDTGPAQDSSRGNRKQSTPVRVGPSTDIRQQSEERGEEEAEMMQSSPSSQRMEGKSIAAVLICALLAEPFRAIERASGRAAIGARASAHAHGRARRWAAAR